MDKCKYKSKPSMSCVRGETENKAWNSEEKEKTKTPFYHNFCQSQTKNKIYSHI
jgi:hypothetical protein